VAKQAIRVRDVAHRRQQSLIRWDHSENVTTWTDLPVANESVSDVRSSFLPSLPCEPSISILQDEATL
jgi:hypothetical protein